MTQNTLVFTFLLGLTAVVCVSCEEEQKVRTADAEAREMMEAAKESAASDDQIAAEELASPNHAEAREWCDPKNVNHMGFEVSKSEMLRLANEMYAAGATGVYVTGIDDFGGKKISASMVAELPADAAARKTLFEWEKSFQESIGEQGTPDVGQKYFFIALD